LNFAIVILSSLFYFLLKGPIIFAFIPILSMNKDVGGWTIIVKGIRAPHLFKCRNMAVEFSNYLEVEN